MQAFVLKSYGPVERLELKEVPVPRERRGHVLIRTHASSINPLDFKVRSGSLRIISGLLRSRWRVLGFDVAGEVINTGQSTHGFRPGERVFAMVAAGGANAEFVSVPTSNVVRIPPDMSFNDAAGIPLAALTALQCLRDIGQTNHTSRVLINGASGGVGVYAVQIAKALGAHVTAVCSTGNIDMVQGLRADRVIDYTITDFAQESTRYDTVLDAVATRSFRECWSILAPNGTYVTTVPKFWDIVDVLKWTLGRRGPRPAIAHVRPLGTDLSYLASLFEQGRIRPIIDRVFPFKQLRDAHIYAQKSRSKGKNIIVFDKA